MNGIVNLNRERKRRARAAEVVQAAENRVVHGQTKGERLALEQAARRRAALLDGAMLEAGGPDGAEPDADRPDADRPGRPERP